MQLITVDWKYFICFVVMFIGGLHLSEHYDEIHKNLRKEREEIRRDIRRQEGIVQGMKNRLGDRGYSRDIYNVEYRANNMVRRIQSLENAYRETGDRGFLNSANIYKQKLNRLIEEEWIGLHEQIIKTTEQKEVAKVETAEEINRLKSEMDKVQRRMDFNEELSTFWALITWVGLFSIILTCPTIKWMGLALLGLLFWNSRKS